MFFLVKQLKYNKNIEIYTIPVGFKCNQCEKHDAVITEFIQSGNSEKKVPFTQGVIDSQGKSVNLKIFA